MSAGWIGVDFDGTLSKYGGWDHGRLGEAVPRMLARVKEWVAAGIEVRIVTARVTHPEESGEVAKIQDWLEANGLPRLAVTAVKDYQMLQLWDDRAIQVEKNTGRVRPKGVWVDD